MLALGLVFTAETDTRLHSTGLSGKYDVRSLEFALALQPAAARVRVTLTSRQSFDLTLADRETADHVVQMMGAVAQGARLAAQLEDGEVRTLYLIVGEHGAPR